MPVQLSDLSRDDFPANPLEKTGYNLEFNDEFDTGELNTNKWIPHYLPQWSSRDQSKANYTFNNGHLVLQITKDQPAWCPEFDGENRASALQTGVFAGEVGTHIGQSRFRDDIAVREAQSNEQKYVPQYGYFETRVKGLTTSANHVSLWMIGYEDVPEKCGEICLFELLGSERGETTSKVRYGIHPWHDPDLEEEFFIEEFALDTAQFHIYAVEWTPTYVDFYIDNVKIRTIHQSIQYPMQLILGMFELPYEGAWNGDYNPDDPYPKTFTVNYVRGYQPEQGYNI